MGVRHYLCLKEGISGMKRERFEFIFIQQGMFGVKVLLLNILGALLEGYKLSLTSRPTCEGLEGSLKTVWPQDLWAAFQP